MTDTSWPFEEPAETPAFVCRHVFDRRAPILVALHDADGDWQFLCDGDHGDDSGEEPKVVCLEDVLALDSSIASIAAIAPGETATRRTAADDWQVHDDLEGEILASVETVGWHVCVVAEDEEGPGFAFSIGLFESFGHPEVICFGPPPETLAAIVNLVSEAARDGIGFVDGAVSSDVIEGHRCAFRAVSKTAYREYFGYALWFYEGDEFPALQIVLPDRHGLFPWEEGASEAMKSLPALWVADESKQEKSGKQGS